jgi:hypothetical protein
MTELRHRRPDLWREDVDRIFSLLEQPGEARVRDLLAGPGKARGGLVSRRPAANLESGLKRLHLPTIRCIASELFARITGLQLMKRASRVQIPNAIASGVPIGRGSRKKRRACVGMCSMQSVLCRC